MLSMRLARICWVMADGWLSFSLKTDSMTDSSVEVVSCPVKAHQSFTTMPKRDDVNIGLGTICWEQYWGAVCVSESGWIGNFFQGRDYLFRIRIQAKIGKNR